MLALMDSTKAGNDAQQGQLKWNPPADQFEDREWLDSAA